ncbi:MAG: hypothetical protein EPN62_08445 [Candidimonas sp.]|nr:MAG: hypothetical protein EPN77_01430 [Candidimonas sp.]TAM23866.1 MAG: hypothetical protein EPN62_08445 [Candidimonas sp.]
MIGIVLICLAPVIFAYLAYYVPSLGLRPKGHSNYGTLIEPQRPIPAASALALTTSDGKPFDLHSLHGKWILVSADQGACPESCVRKLFILRNSHASQGKEVERLTRVWFVTDNAPTPARVLAAYKGTLILHADPKQLAAYLTPGAPPADALAALKKPMWIIDPLGNLMMQFPEQADPIKVRDDIKKLLARSSIG